MTSSSGLDIISWCIIDQISYGPGPSPQIPLGILTIAAAGDNPCSLMIVEEFITCITELDIGEHLLCEDPLDLRLT